MVFGNRSAASQICEDNERRLFFSINHSEHSIQGNCPHPQSEVGAQFYETLGLEGEISLALRKLKEWAAPRPVKKNLLTLSDTVYIRPEPLGVVLIIGAWNYPWAVTIQPLIGAIAAGTAARHVCVCVCTPLWVKGRRFA